MRIAETLAAAAFCAFFYIKFVVLQFSSIDVELDCFGFLHPTGK